MGRLDNRASERITGWLTTMGLTQDALADQIGESPSWVSRALRGREFDADLDRLERMIRALGKSWSELLDDYPTTPSGEVAYRFAALDAEAQDVVLKQLRRWSPALVWPPDEQSGESDAGAKPTAKRNSTRRGNRPK